MCGVIIASDQHEVGNIYLYLSNTAYLPYSSSAWPLISTPLILKLLCMIYVSKKVLQGLIGVFVHPQP